jgi:hypothetical protein
MWEECATFLAVVQRRPKAERTAEQPSSLQSIDDSTFALIWWAEVCSIPLETPHHRLQWGSGDLREPGLISDGKELPEP